MLLDGRLHMHTHLRTYPLVNQSVNYGHQCRFR